MGQPKGARYLHTSRRLERCARDRIISPVKSRYKSGFCNDPFTMSDNDKISAECLTPILYVRDFAEAMSYYTEKLLFRKLWDWEDPPSFGAVGLGKVEIFLCLGGQGHPGT